MTLYADYIMLYHPIYIHQLTMYDLLQQDIDEICTWTTNNLLKFNSTKCKYMVISRKRSPSQPNTPLTVDNLPMEHIHSYKYLGVLLTSNLNGPWLKVSVEENGDKLALYLQKFLWPSKQVNTTILQMSDFI